MLRAVDWCPDVASGEAITVFLHQSNRLENLFAQLLAVLERPLADPLQPECIVVPNQGMAQWLAHQTALATGIAANLSFPLPGRFVWELLQRLSTAPAEEDLLARPVLSWRIASLLPDCLDHPLFTEIAVYLADDADGRKLLQLARRISEVFDQYLVFRPDLLARWQRPGQGEHWQALLWQRLTAGGTPLRALLGARCRQLIDRPEAPADLPERVLFFGLNALPPVYLEIVDLLSRRTEVHLFHLSPCRHYWTDLRSARQLAAARRRTGPGYTDDLYDSGNPLLLSLGRAGRAFLHQLVELGPEDIDSYQEGARPDLLTTLQNDILDLHDRSRPGEERFVLRPKDRSVQLHLCCSPLREVQVLHDRLLDLFQTLPELKPADILVIAPDIRLYAGAIAGVFGAAAADQRIPWSLADQSPRERQPLVRCCLDLLALLAGRCTAPEVLALCEHDALLARFDLDSALLPRMHEWVREAGIRWGLDVDHHRQLGVQTTGTHSWRFGLDRLLLGHLMGDSDEPWQGLLPCAGVGSGETAALGGFVTLIDTLNRWHGLLRGSRSPDAWHQLLFHLLDEFFLPNRHDQGLQTVREAITAFERNCRLAGCTLPLTPEAVRQHLEEELSLPDGGQPFLSGRVTFANMVPMRSVPFRVIWLLGMNDTAFPRSQCPASFDLMAQAPRPGDRDRRSDDRYLFLEALLSARDVFAVSWVGCSVRDDSASPPSPVVGELLDHLTASCHGGGQPAGQLLTIEHPMQPFSQRCFAGPSAIASYNRAWLPAEEQAEPRPFWSVPLDPPVETEVELKGVELARLVRFWRNPVHFFLTRVLGLRVDRDSAALEESEPFVLNGLQQFQLRQQTVGDLLSGRESEELFAALTATGQLPQVPFDRLAFTDLADQAERLAEPLYDLLAEPREPLAVHLDLGRWHLTGQLTGCFRTGRVTWRSGARKAADLVELWLLHLVLHLAGPADLVRRSTYLARDRNGTPQWFVLGPVDDPAPLLRDLLDRYQLGLTRPLHFFPKTALAWAEAAPGREMARARAAWTTSEWSQGEDAEPAYAWFLADIDPLDEAFAEQATLFRTILAHQEN